MKQIGEGDIRVNKKGKKWYDGSIPFEKNERVCLISTKDLDALITNATFTITMNRIDMDKRIYPLFPDTITWIEGKEKFKLFLDRHLYARYFKDCIIVRYQSVDEAFFEGEL